MVKPSKYGAAINQTATAFPNISPDDKYLFFATKKAQDYTNNAYWVKTDKIISPVGINIDGSNSPNGIELLQKYPNPFNPSTTIQFSLPYKPFAEINIYNVKGELVAELGKKIYNTGLHSLEFNSSGLNSGQYFYKFKNHGCYQD